MTKDLDEEDLALVRGLLSRERTQCGVAIAREARRNREDVVSVLRSRKDRCSRLATILEEPEGPHQLLYRNSPVRPDQEPA